MADFTKLLPVPGQTGVPRTVAVNFTVLEGARGAQINSLSVSVGGEYAIQGGSFINGFIGQIFPGAGCWIVSIHPHAPSFLPHATEVDISASVLDSYGAQDSYGWSFFTIGYIQSGDQPPTPPGGPIPLEPPTRACLTGRPSFIHNNVGLDAALDEGVGTEVELTWRTASPSDENNFVVYNIYSSTCRIDVFDSPPRLLATGLSATIGGLPPGDTRFFAVRAAELDPSVSSLSGLQQAGQDLFFYPSARTIGSVGDGYLSILSDSVDRFPSKGVILIEDELIRYSSIQQVPPAFITDGYGRGWQGTVAEDHPVNTEIILYRGMEDGNTNISQATPTFQKPEIALTYTLGDGYGPDGYRDGYDGYASTDGYLFPRQVKRDDITTPVEIGHDGSGEFPPFDHCGTWRRLPPRNFWNGQCTGTYFGGIQYRDGEFVRETNVANHMLQREELLLDTTGEPFVLLRRKWTGIRCTCHMLRREHPDKRCPICFGTSFQNGYDQFLNPRRPDARILARVDPATEDLKIEDKGGLTPDYMPSAWTIAFPGLRDRDVLVRFNEDNTEEFRYMILNVERVRAFFGQPGAQKFRMQRFHRTDIIYQFPIQRDMTPFPYAVETGSASAPGIPAHKHVLYMPNGISLGNVNGVTAIGERHSHVVRNGVVLPTIGHTHTLTF